MWYHMLFRSVPSTFKCTTLTSLLEVCSNRSFFSPLASCPLPRTLWRHLHFHKKWQQHSASWNNVLLYLQETTVGGLLFGISVSFCYFSRPFAKEKKKKKEYSALHFYIFFHSRLPERWTNILWLQARLLTGWHGLSGPVEQTLLCLPLGSSGGRGSTNLQVVSGSFPYKAQSWAWSKEEGEEERQGLWPAWRLRISRSTASNQVCVHS